jgi:hypothetical protein
VLLGQIKVINLFPACGKGNFCLVSYYQTFLIEFMVQAFICAQAPFCGNTVVSFIFHPCACIRYNFFHAVIIAEFVHVKCY